MPYEQERPRKQEQELPPGFRPRMVPDYSAPQDTTLPPGFRARASQPVGPQQPEGYVPPADPEPGFLERAARVGGYAIDYAKELGARGAEFLDPTRLETLLPEGMEQLGRGPEGAAEGPTTQPEGPPRPGYNPRQTVMVPGAQRGAPPTEGGAVAEFLAGSVPPGHRTRDVYMERFFENNPEVLEYAQRYLGTPQIPSAQRGGEPTSFPVTGADVIAAASVPLRGAGEYATWRGIGPVARTAGEAVAPVARGAGELVRGAAPRLAAAGRYTPGVERAVETAAGAASGAVTGTAGLGAFGVAHQAVEQAVEVESGLKTPQEAFREAVAALPGYLAAGFGLGTVLGGVAGYQRGGVGQTAQPSTEQHIYQTQDYRTGRAAARAAAEAGKEPVLPGQRVQPDPLRVLGLEPGATSNEINAAWRQRAARVSREINAGAGKEEALAVINAARDAALAEIPPVPAEPPTGYDAPSPWPRRVAGTAPPPEAARVGRRTGPPPEAVTPAEEAFVAGPEGTGRGPLDQTFPRTGQEVMGPPPGRYPGPEATRPGEQFLAEPEVAAPVEAPTPPPEAAPPPPTATRPVAPTPQPAPPVETEQVAPAIPEEAPPPKPQARLDISPELANRPRVPLSQFWEQAGVAKGEPTKVQFGEEGIEDAMATRALVPLGKIIASHQFEVAGMPANEKFATPAQGRDYENEQAAQLHVIQNAQKFDPIKVLDRTNSVSRGPPLLNATNEVLAGHGRMGIIMKALRDSEVFRHEYLEGLKQYWPQEMWPILEARNRQPPEHWENYLIDTRVLDNEAGDFQDVARMQRINLGSDVPEQKPKSMEEEAAEFSARFKANPSMLNHFIDTFDPQQTFLSYLDTGDGKMFVDYGQAENVFPAGPKYIKGGKITNAGKLLLQTGLEAAAYGQPEQLARAPGDIKRKLDAVTASLVQSAEFEGWDIAPKVLKAFDVINAFRSFKAAQPKLGTKQKAVTFKQWREIEEDSAFPRYQPWEFEFADLLLTENASQLKQRFRDHAETALATGGQAKQMGLGFGYTPTTPSEAFEMAFGIKVRFALEAPPPKGPKTPPVEKPDAGGESQAEPSLSMETWEGEVGRSDHLTGKEKGRAPTSVIAALPGGRGEIRGAHPNRQGVKWDEFKEDIKTSGIKEAIFIVVEPDGSASIYEGNHRIDAAVEVGLPTVPVEIRYFGKAERHGSIVDRVAEPVAAAEVVDPLADPDFKYEPKPSFQPHKYKLGQKVHTPNGVGKVSRTGFYDVEGNPGYEIKVHGQTVTWYESRLSPVEPEPGAEVEQEVAGQETLFEGKPPGTRGTSEGGFVGRRQHAESNTYRARAEAIERAKEFLGMDAPRERIDWLAKRKLGEVKGATAAAGGHHTTNVRAAALEDALRAGPDLPKEDQHKIANWLLGEDNQVFGQRSPPNRGPGERGAIGVEMVEGEPGVFSLLRERFDAAGRAIKGGARRQFTSAGDLPADMFARKVQKDGWYNSQLKAIGFTMRDFRTAAREVKGVKGTYALSTDELALLNEVLQGSAPANLIPPQLGMVIRQMRAEIDAMSRRLKESGIVEGDLEATIEENYGVYLNRSYRAFDDPKWSEKVPQDVRNRAKNLLRDEIEKAYTTEDGELSITPEELEERTEGLVAALLFREEGSPLEFFMKGKLGQKNLSILRKRKDISPEIRALMGEYKDPMINYVRTMSKMAKLLANHEFLVDVREQGVGKIFFEEPMVRDGVEYSALIAAEGSEALAPLNGYYTSPEIRRAMEAIEGVDAVGPWLRRYMKVNGTVKVSKTVLSAMTHIRNFVANPMFLVAGGHVPGRHMGRSARALAGHLGPAERLAKATGRDTESMRKYILELTELGVIGESARANELMDVYRDASKRGVAEYGADPTRSVIRKGIDASGALYLAEDDFWKIDFYEAELKDQRWVHQEPGFELSDQEVKQKSATITRNGMPTYSLVPPGMKVLRRSPLVGTFVSFPSEVYRVGYHGLTQTATELRSENPRERVRGWKRLMGMLIAAGVVPAVTKASRMMHGIAVGDDDDARHFLAPWSRNSSIMYTGRKPNGDMGYIDLSYTDPFNYLRKPVIALMNGQDWEQRLTQSVLEIAKPFVGEEILAERLIDIQRNKQKSGAQVFNPAASPEDRMWEMLDHVWGALEPGTLSSLQRIDAAHSGEKSQSGRAYDFGDEMKALFLGVRFSSLDVRQALAYRARDTQRQIANAERILLSAAANRGNIGKAGIDRAYADMDRARQKAWKDTRTYLEAANRLGVSFEELPPILIQAGWSQSDAAAIIVGYYPAYRVSDNFYVKTANQESLARRSRINALADSATAVHAEELQKVVGQ